MALELLNDWDMLRNLAIIALIFSSGLLQAETAGKNMASECPNLVSSEEFQLLPSGPGAVDVNGKTARVYPLEFTLRNLGLPPNGDYSGVGNIALVGEGFGRLLPHILNTNDAVIAIDLWYGETSFLANNEMSLNMMRYIESYGPFLAPGSATNLPLKDQSQMLVLSHMLLLNLGDFENQFYAVNEATRVLAPGGKAIFAYHGQGVSTSGLKSALESEWGSKVKVSSKVFASRLDFSESADVAPDRAQDDPVHMTVHQLIIERLEP